eukprot:3938162-Rhodomonas_salina.1
MPVLAYNKKKFTYLDAEILELANLREATELQLPFSYCKWNLRALLDIIFKFLKTLLDVGVSARTKALAAAIRHWSELWGASLPESAQPSAQASSTRSCHAWRDDLTSGPFKD